MKVVRQAVVCPENSAHDNPCFPRYNRGVAWLARTQTPIALVGVLLFEVLVWKPFVWATPQEAPAIQTLLKPQVYQRASVDREIMTNASLDEIPEVPDPNHQNDKSLPPLKRYHFYATMQVRASLSLT